MDQNVFEVRYFLDRHVGGGCLDQKMLEPDLKHAAERARIITANCGLIIHSEIRQNGVLVAELFE